MDRADAHQGAAVDAQEVLRGQPLWARKGAYLCVLSDTTPSMLPTAQAVESSADLSIAGKGCYTKR